MISVILVGLVGLYLVCGFFAWGLTLGYFTNKYPWWGRHTDIAMKMALGGPVGLLVALIKGDRDWRVKPISEQEVKEAFKKEFPFLNQQDHFEWARNSEGARCGS